MEEMAGIIVIILIGGGFSLFGWIIKSQNAGDMINFFDVKKHSKEKFSKIFGDRFFVIGTSMMAIGVVGLLMKDINIDLFKAIPSMIMILGLLKTFYSA